MKKTNQMKTIVSYFMIGILMFFMLSIFVRFFTRQILVKRLGIDNAFTAFVFFDNVNMETADLGGHAEDNSDGYTNVTINWEHPYPFNTKTMSDTDPVLTLALLPQDNRYVRIFNSLKEKVDVYSSDLLVGQSYITELSYGYNNLMNWKWGASGADEDSTIIYMENGYLTYQQPQISEEDISEIADSIEDFSDYLADKNIPFLYVNAGSKVNPIDKQLSALDESNEYTNENGDSLQAALAARNVNYLDMRQEMLTSGLDWYSSYYKTDHHWTAETGLWAAGVIAQKLNEVADMNFNMTYFDESSYDMIIHEDALFGGQGQTVTRANAEFEDFTEIQPKFKTDFYVQIPTKSFEAQGEYRNTLYDPDHLQKCIMNSNGGVYSSTRWTNDAVAIIKNNIDTENHDKKLLILSDSFGFYLNTYLACDIGETDIIHPMAFDGSIRSYVDEMNPDAVIVLYCERNIKPIDWSNHLSQFDFR
ncbi:MAG: hypothetical protein ACI4EE_02750 [Lachnospiraceae bacterium]